MKQQYTWGLMLNEYDLVLRGGLGVGVYCYRDAGQLSELHLVNYCPLEHFHHIRIRKNGPAHWFVVDLMAGVEIEAVFQSLQTAYRFACGLLGLLHHEECVLPDMEVRRAAEWHLTDEEVYHKDISEQHDKWTKGQANE